MHHLYLPLPAVDGLAALWSKRVLCWWVEQKRRFALFSKTPTKRKKKMRRSGLKIFSVFSRCLPWGVGDSFVGAQEVSVLGVAPELHENNIKIKNKKSHRCTRYPTFPQSEPIHSTARGSTTARTAVLCLSPQKLYLSYRVHGYNPTPFFFYHPQHSTTR